MATQLPPLLPRPRHAEPKQGVLPLGPDVPIVLGPDADEGDFRAARSLAAALEERTGLRLPIETHERTEGLGRRIELVRQGDDGEAYEISVEPDRARVSATGRAGLRWANATLTQLVDAKRRLPACHIDDAPQLAMRGLMLDVSRGKVPTEATLRELVDRCAALKLNVLMLYVEHTFRFRRHPEIGASDSPLDAETLRRLDAYAADRGVELIPTLQSLGHMGHVLKHERYAHLAESELGWSLSPAEPGTYELLDDLYDEFLPNFRSRWLNANCDEPWDLGRGKSKPRETELGPGGVYLEHVRWLHAAARARGRRLMIWGDVVHNHPERAAELPRDVVMLDWWYEAELDFDRCHVFEKHGLDFAVCPGTSSWNCLFPRVQNSLDNITGWADAGRRHGALGLICTDWGDFGHYNLQGNSWLGFAWAAQQAWSGKAPDADFDRAFGRLFFGESRGEVARCYRALGAVHDAGFRVFNGSALQFLFFDDLERAFFHRQAKAGALRRSAAKLERVRARLEAAGEALDADPTTAGELQYALDASDFAVRKSLAALEWLDWRQQPASLKAAQRRKLAKRLNELAQEQRSLAGRLRRLWHARSAPSNFAITGIRIDRSVASLRKAARALERGQAPPPPEDDTQMGEIFRELRMLCEAAV